MPLLNIYCLSNSDIYKESIAKDVHGIVSLEADAVDLMYCPGEKRGSGGVHWRYQKFAATYATYRKKSEANTQYSE